MKRTRVTSSHDYRFPGRLARFASKLGFGRPGNLFWSRYEPRNFGDWIGPYLYEAFTGKRPIHCSPLKNARECIFSAGSILRRITEPDRAIVWGSGIISEADEFARPRNVLAVRGPVSAHRIRAQGYRCPDVYGDPGILLPLVYHPNTRRVTGRIGVIPHYFDFTEIKRITNSDLHIIDVTRPVEDVIDDICTCEKTISSSLHGLIVSHAYRVPTIWITSVNDLIGDGSKFIDYFESIGNSNAKPARLDFSLPRESLLNGLEYPRVPDLKAIQEALMNVCPILRQDG